MKVISSTRFRRDIAKLLNAVVYRNQIVGIERHNKVQAVVFKWPARFNEEVDEITNVNANSSSFDFLEKEPDLYSIEDLRKRYV